MKRKIAAGVTAVALAVGGLMWATPAMAEEAEPLSQPEFICNHTGDGWQDKVDWDGETNPTVNAPDGFLIAEYCVKAGTVGVDIDVDPDAASVVIDHPDKPGVSHYQVRLVAVVVEPLTVIPNQPVVKDLCETENDHYGLPDETAGIEYSRDGLNIVATITAENTSWGTLPAGWTETGDTTAVFEFNAEQFTDVNCEEVLADPAAFAAEPFEPTCDDAGALPLVELAEHVTLTWDREFDGPGTYTLTATADEGYEFADGSTVKTREFTVLGALGYQSEDPEAECYFDEPEQVTLATPSIHDECGTENDFAELPANSEGVTYYWYDEEDESELDVVAVIEDGYFLGDALPAGWAHLEGNVFIYEQGDFTDEPCPTTPPAPPKPATPASLAVTGFDPAGPLTGAAALLLSGIGALIWRRVRA